VSVIPPTSKPGKFGIKVSWFVDADNTMSPKCLIYLGAETLANANRVLIENLIEPYLDKGRNVTTDNYFSRVHLGESLSARRTTLVETIRNNRQELPPESKLTTSRQHEDSQRYYTNQHTLCSFWDEGEKPVLLL
jgi:hypothetical protein